MLDGGETGCRASLAYSGDRCNPCLEGTVAVSGIRIVAQCIAAANFILGESDDQGRSVGRVVVIVTLDLGRERGR